MEVFSSINLYINQAINLVKISFIYLCFLLSTFTIILWMSIFLYGCFYYLYMPIDSHIYPIYWQFKSGEGKYASFPSANLSLTTPLTSWQRVIVPDQQYRIMLEMEMPDSPNNRQLGMFMCHIRMMTEKGVILQSSRRFAMIQYQSPIMRFIKTVTLAPLFLMAFREEKQMMGVTLFEKYVDNKYHPTSYAWVELESDRIELYTSYLKIHAQYKGLRYIMFNWPTLSALYGVCSNAAFLSLIALLSWYQFFVRKGLMIIMPPHSDTPSHKNAPTPAYDLSIKSSGENFKVFHKSNQLPENSNFTGKLNMDFGDMNSQRTNFTTNSTMPLPFSPTNAKSKNLVDIKVPCDGVRRRKIDGVRSKEQKNSTIKNREIISDGRLISFNFDNLKTNQSRSRGLTIPIPRLSISRESLSLPINNNLGPHKSFHSLDQYMTLYNMPTRISKYLPSNKDKTISKLVKQLDHSKSLSQGNLIDFNLYDEAISSFENKNLFFNNGSKNLCCT